MADPRPPRVLDYRRFGEALVLSAVTPERVVEAVTRIAGEVVELGPIGAGPGGKATVYARGRIGVPVADEAGSDPLVYQLTLPVEVALEVHVRGVNRYDAVGEIPMRLAVKTVEPLAIFIDVEPVRPADIRFRIDAQGLQAKLLGRAGDVGGELRRHTADYVNARLGSPDASRYTRLDLLPIVEQVWSGI